MDYTNISEVIILGAKVGFWMALILSPFVFIEADKKRKKKNGDKKDFNEDGSLKTLKQKGYFPDV